MADTKVSALTELTALDVADELLVVDKSDTSMAASGTDKRIKPPSLGLPLIVRKTADETVNNSTTLQNDDHLVFPVAASSSYLLDLTLLTLGASVNADWKIGWTVPASTTMKWGAMGNAAANVTWAAVAAATSQVVTQIESTSAAVGGAAVAGVIPIRAIIVTAGTAGNVQCQWAQNTQTAEDSKFLTNSVGLLTKIG